MKYKIDDRVKIVDTGCLYSSWSTVSHVWKLKKWKSGWRELKTGDTGTIIKASDDNVYAVYIPKYDVDIIINGVGLVKANLLPEELFML